MPTPPLRRAVAALLVLLMTACAAPRPIDPSPASSSGRTGHDPELPYPPPRPPQVGDILHLPTGFFVSEEAMLQSVVDARVVYVGETHDNPASHRQELALLRAMVRRHPGKVALGMEMFTPAQQDALDRWVAGELSEKEFLRAARWYEVWRMDFDYYRDLLLFARDERIPVIGLNAEKSLVRAVRNQEGEVADLPELDLGDPYQRALTETIFGGHAHGEMDAEAFVRVQTLWDETMAENVARYLKENEGMRMLVVAGGNHVRHGFGIPRRVFRRLPHAYVLVGSKEIEIPEDRQDRLMDVPSLSFPMPPYHFLAFTRYEKLEKEIVKLGIALAEGDAGVTVGKVLPGSAAEGAGVREGDRIVRFDEQPVGEVFDVLFEMGKKRPGDRALLTLWRDGEEVTVDVLFPAKTPPTPAPSAP